MKKTAITILILWMSTIAYSQQLYVKTFGSATAKPAIFLHGGPGYNASSFEATTAKPLADKGFFVIVYDRRGEGRSLDKKATYTFDESFTDLLFLYDSLHLKMATLIGHSFGGLLATKFSEKHPEKVSHTVLVSSPINFAETFDNIIAKSKKIYDSTNNSTALKYIGMLEEMDASSLQYSTYCFAHAMQNGFYSTKTPTEQAKQLYAAFKKDSLYKYAAPMSTETPTGFWKNEQYTSMDISASIANLSTKYKNVFALYSKEDGLFSEKQIAALSVLVNSNLVYADNASHSFFIDRQDLFLEWMVKWCL